MRFTKKFIRLKKRVAKLETRAKEKGDEKKLESESRVDPKMIEEILKFTKNVVEAPKLVSAPDEISLEVTSHDVVQEIDKTRLLTLQAN